MFKSDFKRLIVYGRVLKLTGIIPKVEVQPIKQCKAYSSRIMYFRGYLS